LDACCPGTVFSLYWFGSICWKDQTLFTGWQCALLRQHPSNGGNTTRECNLCSEWTTCSSSTTPRHKCV